MRRRHLLLTAAVVAGALAQDASAAWHRPVAGAVTRPFDYSRSRPFERGAHRDAWFAPHAGEPVKAACSGVVSYAGPSPGGNVVTVRCGRLVATHLGLADVRVGGGGWVRAGARIGHAGAHGVGLGARHANDRWGYIDPLRLIGVSAPHLGPAPVRVRGEPPPAPAAAPRAAFRKAPAGRAPAPPLVAWAGLALVAATLTGLGGGTVRRRWGPSTSRRRSTTSTPRRT